MAVPIIVSLALDNGRSNFAKLCQLPFSLWMGKVSMSVYLIQDCIIRYFTAIVNVFAPDQVHLTDYTPLYMNKGSMPWWGIFIVVPSALLFGSIIEKYVEEPCRKKLRAQKRDCATPLPDQLPNDAENNL